MARPRVAFTPPDLTELSAEGEALTHRMTPPEDGEPDAQRELFRAIARQRAREATVERTSCEN